MFSVLKFAEPEAPEVVPTSWVDERKKITKWPPCNDTKQIMKAIMHSEDPQQNWQDFPYEKILFRNDDYNEALQKRKDAEMFSDVENEERMKRTRSDRHKKCLSDFEMDNIVEKDNGSENEAEKESDIVEEEFRNEEIKTKIQNNKSAEENKKLTRKRIYDSDNNCNDILSCPAKLMKSTSNIVESVSIKKRINIPYTQEVIVPARNDRGNEDNNFRSHKIQLSLNTAKKAKIVDACKDNQYAHKNLESRNIQTTIDTTREAATDNLLKDILTIILTKQNKIIHQNDIILSKLSAIQNMQLQNNVTDSVELPQNVKEELSKIFIIKTVENLESFDDRLKKKKYFYYVVSI